MADIVERLRLAANDESQLTCSLTKEAADAIEKLREEVVKLRGKMDQYQRLAEPEF